MLRSEPGRGKSQVISSVRYMEEDPSEQTKYFLMYFTEGSH